MAEQTLARRPTVPFLASLGAISAALQTPPGPQHSRIGLQERDRGLLAQEPRQNDQEVGTTNEARDKEIFLDQFSGTQHLLHTQTGDQTAASEAECSLETPFQNGPLPSSLMVRIPFQSSSAQNWANIKRVVPTVSISSKPELHKLQARWSCRDFMTGTRSASQQASLELAVQIFNSRKLSVDGLHSMIKCSEQQVIDVKSEPNERRSTPMGYPCCSHPGCTKQVQYKGKCIAHGGVRTCSHPDCSASVGSGRHGLCFRHGGRPICSEEGCTKTARKCGKCPEHGGGLAKICKVPDCTNGAQKRGLCVGHGGYSICKMEGCDGRVLTKGLCRHHGGGTKCQSMGCDKLSQKHGYCHKHAVENGMKVQQKGRCKEEGCLKFRARKGYCSRHAQEHGITVGRKCEYEGCDKNAQAGGFCIGHGGGYHCKHPGCTKLATSKGLCCAHGGRIMCKAPGCEKWGLTNGLVKGFCIQHGGGRRCKHPGCNKSVQIRGLCSVHSWYRCQAEGCDKKIKIEGFCKNHSIGGGSGRTSSEESSVSW